LQSAPAHSSQAQLSESLVCYRLTASQPRCCKGSALHGSRQPNHQPASTMTRNVLDVSPSSHCAAVKHHFILPKTIISSSNSIAMTQRRLTCRFLPVAGASFRKLDDALIALAVYHLAHSFPLSAGRLESSGSRPSLCTVQCLVSLGCVVKLGRASSCRRHTKQLGFGSHIISLA
jgi:hypothetical protein